MKLLITGASGFIGGFLVEEALKRGYEIWAGVRKGSNLSRLHDPRVHFIDLRYDNPYALTEQLAAFACEKGAWDYVIHNAGITKTCHTGDFFRINAGYTEALVESLADAVCMPDKFLLMSSLSAFGPGNARTLAPIRPDDPQCPDSVYGKSKMEAERIVQQQSSFPYIILRPTGVYGPGEKDYFMEIKSIQSGFDFTAGLHPQHISFIYVKDLAKAAFMALENPAAINQSWFVSDGQAYTDNEFAHLIKEILGKKYLFRIRIPLSLVYLACVCSDRIGRLRGQAMTLNSDKYRTLKGRNWLCDTSSLQNDIGFTPDYRLRQGLEDCIRWYRAQGWLK